MNLSQLQQGLEQAFYIEQHRIVFWYMQNSHLLKKSKP